MIPFRLTDEWNLISRTIAPVIYRPRLAPGLGDTFGLGDVQQSFFRSPAKPGAVIWGAGVVLQFPTATDDVLGQGKWGAGPTAAALTIQGPWVIGTLINNVWSFAGDGDCKAVNQMLRQPFVDYNFPGGWYVNSVPKITADWEAHGSDRCSPRHEILYTGAHGSRPYPEVRTPGGASRRTLLDDSLDSVWYISHA